MFSVSAPVFMFVHVLHAVCCCCCRRIKETHAAWEGFDRERMLVDLEATQG